MRSQAATTVSPTPSACSTYVFRSRSLDARSHFAQTSIQIRILKQVLAAERQRQADTAAILDSIHSTHPELAVDHLEPPAPGTLLLTAEPTPMDGHVIAQLQALTARQNERDMVYDAADLRQLMRTALQANNDLEMIKILQVGRDEMPEAIKTLQRALEKEVEREREREEAEAKAEEEAVLVEAATAAAQAAKVNTVVIAGATLSRSATVASRASETSESTTASSSRRTTAAPRDTLDREFIETGIDALRRLSGAEVRLPSWTITRYEVEREEKIGLGFFSDVYRGTWRSQVVAIKVLAPTTPRELFVHEVSVLAFWLSRRVRD